MSFPVSPEIVESCVPSRLGRGRESEDGFVRAVVIIISVPNRPARTRLGALSRLVRQARGWILSDIEGQRLVWPVGRKILFPVRRLFFATASLSRPDKPTLFPNTRIPSGLVFLFRVFLSLPLPLPSLPTDGAHASFGGQRSRVSTDRTRRERRERKRPVDREKRIRVYPPYRWLGRYTVGNVSKIVVYPVCR